MCKYLHLAPGFRFFISLSRFLAGSSEISSSSGSGTDSDSDTPLSNLLPSTSAAPSHLADNDNDGAQNILSLLSDQSTSIKVPEIHSDVASLLTGFLLNGVANYYYVYVRYVVQSVYYTEIRSKKRLTCMMAVHLPISK
nr:unnamed protein product [Callosobruchus analis]